MGAVCAVGDRIHPAGAFDAVGDISVRSGTFGRDMKRVAVLAGILGLTLFGVLLASSGVDDVARAVGDHHVGAQGGERRDHQQASDDPDLLTTNPLGQCRVEERVQHDDRIACLAGLGQLHRAAHDLRLAVSTGDLDLSAEEPALTRPLEVITAPPTHWMLIGSLLVDLRRIHDSLAAHPEA